MIGSSKNNRENAFEHKKEKPGLSVSRPSNNWAVDVRSMVVRTLDVRPLDGRPLVIYGLKNRSKLFWGISYLGNTIHGVGNE